MPSRQAAIEGEERICSGKHRELQLTRAGERKLFDKKARKAFLGWFAATGNVVWSAERVGFSDKTVWRHRMDDPRFAEAFDRAFEQSLMRNKARMVERKAKERPIAIDGGVGEAELEDCDLEKAWPLIVEMERAKGRSGGGGAPIGRPGNRGRMPRAASNAEVRNELEKRLCAFARRIRAEGKEPPAWLPPVEPRKSAKAYASAAPPAPRNPRDPQAVPPQPVPGTEEKASVPGTEEKASVPGTEEKACVAGTGDEGGPGYRVPAQAPPPPFGPAVAMRPGLPPGSAPDCRSATPPSPSGDGVDEG